MSRVVNLRDYMRAGNRFVFDLPPGVVRVDRGTLWGNPYAIGGTLWRAGEEVEITREVAIDAYRPWLIAKIEGNPEFVEPLRGKVLACWCAPDACHADVILEYLDTHEPVTLRAGAPLRFGTHRQPVPDADTAPAWTPITQTKRNAEYRRWLKREA